MPRYIALIIRSEDSGNESAPPGLREEMDQFVNDQLKSGVLIHAAGLEPTSEGLRVRLSRGRVTVTDGPFTEAKEVVGGFALVETPSKQEAVDLATRYVDMHRRHRPGFEFTCEVRLVAMDIAGLPQSPASTAASS